MTSNKAPEASILIGPPGAGKSTVGGLLAREVEIPFVDSDALIEKEQSKTISEIFVEEGESFFRELEERAVLGLLEKPQGVIALGGGAILSEKVAARLRTLTDMSAGKVEVLFLDVSIAHAAPRVGFNRERPLLMVNPRGSWQELMNKRRPIYESLATRIIDTNSCTPEDVVRMIVDGWGR
jgi:shikimate kinase